MHPERAAPTGTREAEVEFRRLPPDRAGPMFERVDVLQEKLMHSAYEGATGVERATS